MLFGNVGCLLLSVGTTLHWILKDTRALPAEHGRKLTLHVS